MDFEVGQIASVLSPTTGRVVLLDGTLLTYIGSGIEFEVGQFVCGAAVPNFFPYGTLDLAWDNTILQLNEANDLPLADFQAAIRSARCCAVKKGSKIIDELEAGCCVEDQNDIKEMLNYIDTIGCVIPEGNITSGRQAVYGFGISSLNNTTHNVTVTIGSVVYSFTTTSSNNSTTIAAEIATHINSFYPQSYTYQAASYLETLVVWGNEFDDDNGTVVDATITDGAYYAFATPKELAFGTASVTQGENSISNNDLQIILNKLCELCKKSKLSNRSAVPFDRETVINPV